jgi:hypothetical protein
VQHLVEHHLINRRTDHRRCATVASGVARPMRLRLPAPLTATPTTNQAGSKRPAHHPTADPAVTGKAVWPAAGFAGHRRGRVLCSAPVPGGA